MDIQLFYLEQYKMLREEIMEYAREIYRTEVYGSMAVGSIYTWFLLRIYEHKFVPHAAWFIAPGLIFICSIHCLMLTFRIKSIAGYLRCLEEVAFGGEDNLPGWEHYKLKIPWLDIVDNIIATLAWIIVLAGSIVISWMLSR